MIRGRMIPCHAKEAIVTVHFYQDGILDGFLQHPVLKHKKKLQSLSQLMLELNHLLDMERCANASVMPLVFSEEEGATDQKVFRIDVLFREHHTWQGKLILENENQETVFHSVMELMEMIDEILGQ